MNKSQQIRDFVSQLFTENHDFSNRELNKQKFIEHFETESSKLLPENEKISWKTHQTLFIDLFKSVCRDKKLDPSQYGYGKPKEKFTKISSDIQSTITPKPKGIQQKPTMTTDPIGTITTQPIQQSDYVQLTHEEAHNLTRIIWKTIGNMASAVKPKFTNFEDAELTELADAWTPLSKPYLEKFGGRVFTALFVTASVMSSRADAFRSEKKQKDNSAPQEKTNPQDSVDFARWKETHEQ